MVSVADPSELDVRVVAARDGDYATYSEAVHDWATEPYQDSWYEALSTENKLLIICPPDTYKSSTVQCYVEKMIGENPNIRILWLMKAGAQAQARVGSVAETIEDNEVYKRAYPRVKANKDKGWSKTMLYVKRDIDGPDPTLMGCGLNGPYQGFHFDIIITDDPTNQQDVKSPSTMESQRDRVKGVIKDRLVRNGRWVAIFTRWGEDDLVPTFKELGFEVVVMPIMAEYPWGPTISNTRFPVDYCQKLRVEKGPAIFDLTYMCDPQAVEGGIIRRENLRYWAHNSMGRPNFIGLPESGTVTLMACDLASSKNTWADPSCIGIGIYEIRTRRLYVTSLWAQRVDTIDFETMLVKQAKNTSNLSQIGVETIGYQATFLQRMRRKYSLPVMELPYRTRVGKATTARGIDKSKEGRAISIAQMFGEGRLFLAENLGYVDGTSVESELCSFPFGKHDDRLDVIAFLCGMADTYTGPKLRVSLGRR